MESFGNLAYNIFPKLLAPMDAAVGEAAYNTPSILSMINGENLDNESVLGLDGKDIVIGIVDTGIDILNEEFLNEYGRTRIKYAWDQSVNSSSGDGYAGEFPFGTYYTEEQLNRFVEEGNSVLRGEDNHGIILLP